VDGLTRATGLPGAHIHLLPNRADRANGLLVLVDLLIGLKSVDRNGLGAAEAHSLLLVLGGVGHL